MPYPNEHAARVRNPDSFEPNSFRSKKLKDGVRLILGKLKSGNGSMVTQAYRFSVDNFTVEQAKKWLKDNKIEYISFEPAKPVSETGGNVEDKVAHSGVLGMKWGKRTAIRGETAGKHLKKKTTIKTSEDFKAVAELRKKHINEMSNEEISKITKRMDLERRYKDLNPTKVTKGKKVTKGVFSGIGAIAGTAGSIAALAGIGSALYKKVSEHISRPGNEIAKALTKASLQG